MSDKSQLKKLRKEAELAEAAAPTTVVGTRFPGTYNWGARVMDVLVSLEERIRNLESTLQDAQLTKVHSITSGAVIQATESKTILSDAVIIVETTQSITADTEVSS